MSTTTSRGCVGERREARAEQERKSAGAPPREEEGVHRGAAPARRDRNKIAIRARAIETMTVLPREIPRENARLLKQNDDLQRLLADSGTRGEGVPRPGSAHSHDPHAPPLTGPTYHDPRPSYAHHSHPTLPPPHFARATLPPLIPTHTYPAHGHGRMIDPPRKHHDQG
ncbi:hypothetical protein C8R45DRAFT_1218265 [Mycena sanguinolenta]|nr:hypothetical protein C8R45DRAFT_1218265 [Mycena sanguinolenta]